MATLSQDDRDLITRYPLDNSLDHLEKSLRDVQQSSTSSRDSHSTDISEDGRQKAISRLLSALMGAEVALGLQSKTSSREVAAELAILFGRVRQGDFNYDHYRPLVKLVIQKAADFEIWSAVLNLITTLSRVTPPAIIPTVFYDTPITHSSSSQQGTEQTRELVKKRLFEEIRSCTYREVGGFIQKYFEAKSWTSRTFDIYQAIKPRHKGGRWTDFPDPPVQAEVLDWWFQFQREFLSKERSLYYTTTSPKDLVGAEAQRQLDLFVKPSDGQTSGIAHDWKDIRVIGELKDPYDNRIFRCLVVSPAGRVIHNYESPLELLEALCDAIKAHESLYRKGNILHRDISENNIIITNPKTDSFKGMLIDLDLAKELGSRRSGARCRTGTMEFMAIEVLLGISHTYRHDLESFLNVLLWQCGRRGWEFVKRVKEQPAESMFTDWYSGTFQKIAKAKRGHMHIDGFEDVLEEFPQPNFDRVKPLCRELRQILFPYKDGLFIGTPKDPEILYGPIIKAFDKAIDDIKAQEG
ncbi:hypothetical protein DV736_g6579, partial [Chaetothyriales sp. CBS 134916]